MSLWVPNNKFQQHLSLNEILSTKLHKLKLESNTEIEGLKRVEIH